jgi:hypothetical protein
LEIEFPAREPIWTQFSFTIPCYFVLEVDEYTISLPKDGYKYLENVITVSQYIYLRMDGCIHGRRIAIILTATVLLLISTTRPRLAVASLYRLGYSHGCDDGRLGFHKYLNTPGNGIDFHTPEFMQGYDKGYKACFSPNGTGNDNKIHSQSDTGGTFVSCNKSQQNIEYCNGYRAGAVDSDVNDDPDENISPSKVTCQGGTSGSEYCHGYQQGYADEDHAMFSPSPK